MRGAYGVWCLWQCMVERCKRPCRTLGHYPRAVVVAEAANPAACHSSRCAVSITATRSSWSCWRPCPACAACRWAAACCRLSTRPTDRTSPPPCSCCRACSAWPSCLRLPHQQRLERAPLRRCRPPAAAAAARSCARRCVRLTWSSCARCRRCGSSASTCAQCRWTAGACAIWRVRRGRHRRWRCTSWSHAVAEEGRERRRRGPSRTCPTCAKCRRSARRQAGGAGAASATGRRRPASSAGGVRE